VQGDTTKWSVAEYVEIQNKRMKSKVQKTLKANFNLKIVFFWVITQRVVVISYRRFGTSYGSETSIRNYNYSLRNKPEECISRLLRGGSLISRRF
jgi:hypothetical protein